MKTKKVLDKEVEAPQGVEVKVEDGIIKVKGEKGEVFRRIINKRITAEVKDNKLLLASKKKASKKEKKIINTLVSHTNNMFKGVTDGWSYKLKICSSHFPMTVTAKDNVVQVTNYIGEKVPRKTNIIERTEVNIDGDIISVTSIDKEAAGQMAANIEKLTKRANFDKRIFMDGIYIIEKAGEIVK